MINKKMFYDKYRDLFGNIKKDSSVKSIDTLINELDKLDIKIRPIEKMSYMLATVRHECGGDMLPITENLNYSARRLTQVWPSRFPNIDIAKKYAYDQERLGNLVYGGRLGNGILEGYKYRGRGYVQITGYDNYKRFEQLLDLPLTNAPDLATKPDTAAQIWSKGMVEGLFTGRKLNSFINARIVDYFGARSVINADKNRVGKNIKTDAKKFEEILRYSLDK